MSTEYKVDVLRSQVSELSRELAARDQALHEHSCRLDSEFQNLRNQSTQLQAIVTGTAEVTGEDFFAALVTHLTSVLGVQYAVIGEIRQDSGTKKILTMAVAAGGALVDNFEYDLVHTPCETALASSFACFERGVQSAFPSFTRLGQLQVEGYCGLSLRAKNGAVIGLLVIMDVKPIYDREWLRSLLTMFAPRATAELERLRAEQERSQALADLHHVMEAIPDMLFTLDLQGNLIRWNRTMERVTGYSANELLNKHALEFVPPVGREPMASAIQQAFRDGYTELESHLLTKDGRTIPYHWTGAPLKNCHGHIIGLTGVGRDITAWKVMGLQRQEQTERLRLAMDIADLATWYWDISTNTVIWSENFEQVNRLPPGTFDGTFEAYQQLVHPDDLPMLFADINRALAGPDPSHTVHRIVSPRGDIQWIEGNGIVYRNESGQPIRMVGTIHNITARRRAEEALRISEERFALAVEGSTDVLWDVHRIPGKPWHAPETLIWWSPRVRQLLGLEEGESFDTLMQWTARLHPDDVNQVFVRLTAHIEQRVPYDVEYRLRTNHGEYRWVWGRGQAIWNEQGEFCRMSGSCQDMTDRKQAQEALRVSEERFATVFNEAAIGVTLVSMDGHWFEVNQALCQIIGYSKEELQNKTFQSLTYPDDLPKSMLLLEKLLSGDLRTHQMEKRYLHKDGHIVWVNLSASSVRNRDGQVLYLIAQIQDITERKYVESARETLQYAIDHGMEGFALLDGQGGYTYMNATHARMYGYEVAELIGQSWKTLYDSDQIATIEAVAFPALQAEGFWRGELTGRLKAGGPVHVEISLQRFPHEGANSEAFLCTCRDTTARKHVEEMLRQRERDLRAAVKERERISEDLHDGILQSIFAVGLGLESCRTFVSKRPSSSKMAATPLMTALNRAIGQLNHVMTDVRNFIAGIDSHMLEDTDVGETVRTMVQAMCASNGTACRVTIEEAAAQELSTEQAYHVMNIVREALSNSLRHSGAVRVTLSLKRLRRSVRLLVTDNGKGFIPEAVRDVGHGLVNMAARARKLGGRIEVRSRPRQGAKVLLDIPRRSADE